MLYCHKNVFTNLLQWNRLAKLKQTWNGWFLNGPLSKMHFKSPPTLLLLQIEHVKYTQNQ
jgi:hypothetical protein